MTQPYIILIEDDVVAQKHIESICPYKVITFNDYEALEISIDSFSPIAVLLDINLGKSKTGIELIPFMRQHWGEVPIIIVSSNFETEFLNKALKAGANEYIEKPVRSSIFLPRLEARINDYRKRMETQTITFGQTVIDLVSHTVKFQDRREQPSQIVFNILVTLFRSAPEMIERETLKSRVWTVKVSDAALDKKIYEARKTLEVIGSPLKIKGVYGKGYSLEILENKKIAS